jgi:hypothetical protein
LRQRRHIRHSRACIHGLLRDNELRAQNQAGKARNKFQF